MGSYGAPSPAQSLSWMLPGALHPWSGSSHFPAELRWQCSPPWLCPEERLVTSPCRGSSAASCPFPSSLVVVPPSFGVLPVYLLGSVVAPLRHPSRGPSCTLRVSARRPSWASLTALLSERLLPLCSRAALPLFLLVCRPGW